MSKKAVAAALAKTIAEDKKEDLKSAFENYLLNPSSLNFTSTHDKMLAFQSARNVQSQIAAWEEDS